MNISYLKTFVTVAKLKSFSKAAQELKLTQPAVSFQIHSLEKEIREVLFDRSGQNVTLTEAGEIFLKYAEKIVGFTERMLDEISELRMLIRGKLEIGASNIPGEYILPIFLSEFKQNYPDVEIRLSVHDTHEVISMLLSHEISLGFCGASAKAVPIIFEEFAYDEIVIAMKPSHPAASKKFLSVKDIKRFPLILREEGSGTRKVFLEALRSQGVDEKDLNIILELGSTQAVLSALSSDIGMAPISIFAIKEHLKNGSLTFKRVEGLNLKRPLFIAYNEKSPFSKAQEVFLELIRNRKNEVLEVLKA
ncbi:MAG: selenium metabolism-associated LysR family transcriptional regulator [Actinobacteria bacterium]|nr:selenium metabolism-associated LysR family transcriptional regulator [Actinomycetota bacterium]